MKLNLLNVDIELKINDYSCFRMLFKIKKEDDKVMKVLIVGDGNSIHICNYIEVVLSKFSNIEITLLDLNPGRQINKESYDFYLKHEVKVNINNGFLHLVKNPIIRRLPKIRAEYYLYKLSKKIKALKSFDYCIIHFVGLIKSKLIYKNKKQFDRIIPVFWGSDVLRNNNLGNKTFKKLFKSSYKIVFNTSNMKRSFEYIYGNSFEEKSEVIKFPTLSFKKIDQIEDRFNKQKALEKYEFPLNKFIIMCGHAGNKAEQHEQMIKEISKLDKNILNSCYFIFPMTYGEFNLITQQINVKKLINNNGIHGKVLTKYLNNDEMLEIIMCTDVFINVVKTDAFSSVMQENLYTGSYVLYGKWLNYYEFDENGIIAQPINDITEIAKGLKYILNNLNSNKSDLVKNKDIISNISSPDNIAKLWKEIVFTTE